MSFFERTPKGEWLLAVLPADCKLSWKKLRAIHGKGTRIATEEAHHFGSVLVVSCHLSKIWIKLTKASTSIIYTLYPPEAAWPKLFIFHVPPLDSHLLNLLRWTCWFVFHSGGHRSHRVLAGSCSTSCCGFCFQGGRGFCHQWVWISMVMEDSSPFEGNVYSQFNKKPGRSTVKRKKLLGLILNFE